MFLKAWTVRAQLFLKAVILCRSEVRTNDTTDDVNAHRSKKHHSPFVERHTKRQYHEQIP